jgi:hypothetical protein
MATLKNMTRVGADVRQIARLLQAKAPENHMLAYITPEEAQLLKDRGGSGMPDPETGIPTYYVPDAQYVDPNDFQYMQNQVYDYGDVRAEPAPDVSTDYLTPTQQMSSSGLSFDNTVGLTPSVFTQPNMAEGTLGFQQPSTFEFVPKISLPPTPSYDVTAGKELTNLAAPARPESEKGVMARLSEATGLKEDTLARLGLGGIQAIIGARASKKAAEQGQRGRQEMEALAAPYLQKGAELQRQAQAGELTPVARQQLEASQAQAAQAASARGGVGAQQTAARIEALRSQLLQQQYDYGLKLSGIGDQISLGAIKTGLQADQVVNQMTNSYYNNIMRTLMPQPKYVIAGQPNVTTE